jgi:hypothetical protein
MKPNGHKSCPGPWNHVLMVALYCFLWLGCSGCASTPYSDESISSDQEYQRQMKEQQEIDNDFFKPGGWNVTFH